MEAKKTQLTKDAALQELGLTTRKARKTAGPLVDFAAVGAGRQLLKRKTFMPAVIVATTGSVNVNLDGNHVAHIEAPFVIDQWAADETRLADFDVVASAESTLLFIDWKDRQAFLNQAPALGRLSNESRAQIQAETVVDLTTPQPVSEPTHT